MRDDLLHDFVSELIPGRWQQVDSFVAEQAGIPLALILDEMLRDANQEEDSAWRFMAMQRILKMLRDGVQLPADRLHYWCLNPAVSSDLRLMVRLASGDDQALPEAISMWKTGNNLQSALLSHAFSDSQLARVAQALVAEPITALPGMLHERILQALAVAARGHHQHINFWAGIMRATCRNAAALDGILEPCLDELGWETSLKLLRSDEEGAVVSRVLRGMAEIYRRRGQEVPTKLQVRLDEPEAYWALAQILDTHQADEIEDWIWRLLDVAVPPCREHAEQIRAKALQLLSTCDQKRLLPPLLTRVILLHGGLQEILALREIQKQATG